MLPPLPSSSTSRPPADALSRIDGADGRGLLARFLYSKPLSLVGSRNLAPDLLDEQVAATYAKHLGGLTLALADWTDPALLTLTPEDAMALRVRS